MVTEKEDTNGFITQKCMSYRDTVYPKSEVFLIALKT